MLDREYLNWIISNSDFKELKGIGDFMDEEVLKRVPVELDEFKNAISDYIKDFDIRAEPLFCLCSYFYYYSMEKLIYVYSRDDYYDSFHDLELWARNKDIKEIVFSTKRKGPDARRIITGERLIKFLLKRIFAHDFKMAISLVLEQEGSNVCQVKASAFHDESFELYYFFKLLRSLIIYVNKEGSIKTRQKRLIMTVLALFKVHTEQSAGNIEELRRKSYNITEKRSRSFWESYNSANKKQSMAFRTKYGYLVHPNTKETPCELKERSDFYYKYKYGV